MWTVGYTLRWIIACAFLVLGINLLGSQASFDAEKIMPLVLKKLPVGMQGMFMSVLLAALMSTLSAMINVTSSVVTNDFLKRYVTVNLTGKALVPSGRLHRWAPSRSRSCSAWPSRTSCRHGSR